MLGRPGHKARPSQVASQMINQWSTELIALENLAAAPKEKHEAEAFFKVEAARYDTCMQELIRQVRLRTHKTAAVLEKVWQGNSGLLLRLMGQYHNQTVQTTKIRKEVEVLSADCIQRVEGSKNQLRNMAKSVEEAQDELMEKRVQISSLKKRLRKCENENERLLGLVKSFVEGDESVELDGADAAAHGHEGDLAEIDHNKQLIDSVNRELDTSFDGMDAEGRRKHNVIKKLDSAVRDLRRHYLQGLANLDQKIETADKEIQAEPMKEMVEKDPDPPPEMPVIVPPQGRRMPKDIREHMSYFPKVKCLASKASVNSLALQYLIGKVESDVEMDASEGPRLNSGSFLHTFLTSKFQLPNLVDMHVIQLVETLRRFNGKSYRITLFSDILGVGDPEEPPGIPERDLDFVMAFLGNLHKHGCFAGLDFESVDAPPESVQIAQQYIIGAARAVFGPVLYDRLFPVLSTICSMPHARVTDYNQWLDIDEVLKAVFTVRSEYLEFWRTKLAASFLVNCSYVQLDGSIVEQAPPPKADGEHADGEQAPAPAAAAAARPAADVDDDDEEDEEDEEEEGDEDADEDNDGTGEEAIEEAPKNPEGTPLLFDEGVCRVVEMVNPLLSAEEIKMVQQELFAFSHKYQFDALNHVWRQATDLVSGRTFFYNIKTKETTWASPFDDKPEYHDRVDLDILVAFAVQSRVIEQATKQQWEKKNATRQIAQWMDSILFALKVKKRDKKKAKRKKK